MSNELKEILNDENQFNQIAESGFNATDTDGSGQIDIKELGNAMNEISDAIGIPHPSKEEVDEVFKSVDTDGSGKISLQEFKTFLRRMLEVLSEL